MFSPRPIGHVRSPYKGTQEVPKGLGAKHDVEGILEILPEFEAGLGDIEGFSHLIVLWVFDRVKGYELLASPPSDDRVHGVFATRSPMRPNPIGLTTVELLRRDKSDAARAGNRHARRHTDPRYQAISDERPAENLRRGWLAEAEARRAKP